MQKETLTGKAEKRTLEKIYSHLTDISSFIEKEYPQLIFIHWDALMQYYTGRKIKKKFHTQLIKLLHKMHSPPRIYISVISSLALSDIEEELGLGEIIYCGNFGMEIESRSFGWSITGAKQIKKQLQALDSRISSSNPFRIEVDVCNLGLIYQIRWENTGVTAREMKKNLLSLLDTPDQFRILSGYQQIDILPNLDWNLGICVERVTSILNLSTPDYLRFYFGSVHNDEPVFQEFTRAADFGIWVGEKPVYKTAAGYHLKNLKELIQFLQWIHSKS